MPPGGKLGFVLSHACALEQLDTPGCAVGFCDRGRVELALPGFAATFASLLHDALASR